MSDEARAAAVDAIQHYCAVWAKRKTTHKEGSEAFGAMNAALDAYADRAAEEARADARALYAALKESADAVDAFAQTSGVTMRVRRELLARLASRYGTPDAEPTRDVHKSNYCVDNNHQRCHGFACNCVCHDQPSRYGTEEEG